MLIILSLLIVISSAINPVIIKGNLMYDSITKKRFYIKGVTYAPNPVCTSFYDDAVADDYTNPFLDYEADLRDISRMNVNTIRLYQISPDKSHAKFMAYAESLGLYVLVPLTGTVWGYLKADVPSPKCYTDEIENYGNVGSNLVYNAKAIMAEFSGYSNTLMFVVGNELMLHSGGPAFPCVKALVRDLHNFQGSCSKTMRRVPLVYAAQDMGRPGRKEIGDFLTCAYEDPSDALDVYGLNIYAYCQNGDAYSISNPYYAVNEDFQNYRAPFIYSEFGCTQAREFTQVPIMMNEMAETLSGGLAYEYSDHGGGSGYGLVDNTGTYCASTETIWREGAFALQQQYNKTGAYESMASNDGAWDDSNRCSWLPPSEQEHWQPTCTTTHDTWSLPLPPTPPEYAPVDCPTYNLSHTELQENVCFDPDPTLSPTYSSAPSVAPQPAPSLEPVSSPTYQPSPPPHPVPSLTPTPAPTHSFLPTSFVPSRQPILMPSAVPSSRPSSVPLPGPSPPPTNAPVAVAETLPPTPPEDMKESSQGSTSTASASFGFTVVALLGILCGSGCAVLTSKSSPTRTRQTASDDDEENFADSEDSVVSGGRIGMVDVSGGHTHTNGVSSSTMDTVASPFHVPSECDQGTESTLADGNGSSGFSISSNAALDSEDIRRKESAESKGVTAVSSAQSNAGASVENQRLSGRLNPV